MSSRARRRTLTAMNLRQRLLAFTVPLFCVTPLWATGPDSCARDLNTFCAGVQDAAHQAACYQDHHGELSRGCLDYLEAGLAKTFSPPDDCFTDAVHRCDVPWTDWTTVKPCLNAQSTIEPACGRVLQASDWSSGDRIPSPSFLFLRSYLDALALVDRADRVRPDKRTRFIQEAANITRIYNEDSQLGLANWPHYFLKGFGLPKVRNDQMSPLPTKKVDWTEVGDAFQMAREAFENLILYKVWEELTPAEAKLLNQRMRVLFPSGYLVRQTAIDKQAAWLEKKLLSLAEIDVQ